MARDKSFEDRRKQRDIEDEEDKVLEEQRKSGTAISGGRSGPNASRTGDAAIDKLLEYFQRVEPLIAQVNSLYNQFVAGAETRPPLERRKQLDEIMAALQGFSKPTPAYQFRYTTLNASYLTHRDRWDKLIMDLESGKIKRTAGPKSGRTG